MFQRFAAAAIGLAMAVGAAEAAVTGSSTNVTGGLRYTGLGNDDLMRGTGLYQPGTCLFDGANTVCTLSGDFTQGDDSSDAPGDVGSFVFTLTYSGTANPVVARSSTPGSDSVVLIGLGDAVFNLKITTSDMRMFSGSFLSMKPEGPINFSIFITQPRCTGLPDMVACTIANIGAAPDADLFAGVSRFSFSIPDPIADPVPVPGALPLMLAGMAGFAGVRRRCTIGRI
ncbi:MAG: PEP-CTERM sorting domain-containing protein [Parvularculaceae bacterium]|nr:PEP-CTERM sorting domain-containing protein [Parvularculaceae bacterium]